MPTLRRKVAAWRTRPDSARAEFQIAIAVPIVSGTLALAFGLVARAVPAGSAASFLAEWLRTINLYVAIFNLLPGFPLDGGRIFRALLWARSGDLYKATRLAAGTGQMIAYVFIGIGAWAALAGGALAGGLWLAFIGWFLRMASGAAVRQMTLDVALRGLRAADVMTADLARIGSEVPVARFARELVMRGRRWALVEDAGAVVGLVTLSDVKRADPDTWDTVPVGRVATPVDHLITAAPETPVRELLRSMGTRDMNQIPIVEAGRIVGAVTRETLVHAIELRQPSAD